MMYFIRTGQHNLELYTEDTLQQVVTPAVLAKCLAAKEKTKVDAGTWASGRHYKVEKINETEYFALLNLLQKRKQLLDGAAQLTAYADKITPHISRLVGQRTIPNEQIFKSILDYPNGTV